MHKLMNKKLIVLFLAILCFCNLFAKDPKFSTNKLLIKALDEQNYDEAIKQLDRGANPNIEYQNESLLMYSIYNGLTDLSLKTIVCGADINYKNEKNFTAMAYSIYDNNLELVKCLLDKNTDLFYYNYRETYFSLAFKKKYFDICNLLLEKDDLIVFLREKYIQNIEVLFDPDYFCDNSLYYYEQIYELSDNEFNACALMISIEWGNFESVKYFVKKEIDLSKRYNTYCDDDNYSTPLDLAESYFAGIQRTINHEILEDGKASVESLEYKENLEQIISLLKSNLPKPESNISPESNSNNTKKKKR